MTTLRNLRIPSALILTLASISTLACIDDASEVELDTSVRAIDIGEAWSLSKPILLEHETCGEYWESRCAELSPSACMLAQTREQCEPAKGGVLVRDAFTAEVAGAGWTAISLGDEAATASKSPVEACESLEGVEYDHCVALAELAQGLGESVPQVLEVAPQGGFFRVDVFEDNVILRAAKDGGEGNLLGEAAGELGWSGPTIGKSVSLGHIGDYIIIEDEIMLMVAPNGLIAGMGTEVLVFMSGGSVPNL